MAISFEAALERIRQRILSLPAETIPLKNSLGLITASPITASMDQPPFPRSPYDGYALRAEDSRGASKEYPVTLRVVGRSFAGNPAGVIIGKNEAVRIMTGGVIPAGADCVLMQEKTDYGGEQVQIFQSLLPFENYCHRGEDFHTGEMLVPAGARVTAAVSAVAASAGRTALSVYPKPLTAVLSTGDELAVPGKPLAAGQIYNSNNAYLCARLTELDVPSLDLQQVDDELEKLAEATSDAARRAKLVITTGGVSVGEKDLVPAALKHLGAEIVFHGVEMKPGMPAALALLGGTPILALSGNPFAAAVTFETLGRAVLACLASAPGLVPELRQAVLAEGYSKRGKVPRFVRATVENGLVRIPGEQGNGQLRSMIGSNCLVQLPAGAAPFEAGTQVNIWMMEGGTYGV